MATTSTQPQQPRTIFEAINQNIVDLSQDMVIMFQKVDAIYNALFPAQLTQAEPTDSGAATINE